MEWSRPARPAAVPSRRDRARVCAAFARRLLATLCLALVGCQTPPTAPHSDPFANVEPRGFMVGDMWIYRVSNGYNREVRGQIRFQVEELDAGHAVVSARPDSDELGPPYTVVYTREGNWLRHPLDSHGQSADYRFATAFPAYPFPLQRGKAWSLRMPGTQTPPGRHNSVRVDGKVYGGERVQVPAGAFDTIRVMRTIYTGDWDGFLEETQVYQVDWYAPQLGLPVRSETKSRWRDQSQCGRYGCPYFHGDWDVYEFVAYDRAPRR